MIVSDSGFTVASSIVNPTETVFFCCCVFFFKVDYLSHFFFPLLTQKCLLLNASTSEEYGYLSRNLNRCFLCVGGFFFVLF